MKAPRIGRADGKEPAHRAKQPALSVSGAGRPLETGLRQTMESRFGHDFGGVRVHDGAKAGVRAFAQGRDIVFGAGQYAPTTEHGRKLIAHELAHIVQQSRSARPMASPGDAHLEHEADRAAEAAVASRHASITTTSAPAIQFKIAPEAAAPEMVGQTFEVTSALTSGGATLAVGDTVRIDTWDVDAAHSVKVTVLTGAAATKTLTLPQRVLRPARTAVKGMTFYGAHVSDQAASVEKGETKLASWQAKKASFTGSKGVALFIKEEARLENLLIKRRDLLNRREIQEAMFNRFDQVIVNEVAAANTAHGLSGKDALDPELVKSQLFQESQLGTAGEFMSDPPTNPVMTRFNLGQVIDSSALALLTLMEAEQKALITKFNLGTIRQDLAAAQSEKAALKKKAHLNAVEQARLQMLENLSKQNWERFLWRYVASGQTKGFDDAVTELFASGAPVARNLDYTFWIHLAVFWLFEKKKSVKTWEDAIRAYNGGGARAQHYKAAIVKRAKDAQATAKKGGEFSAVSN
ncbi:eCIS core domain-containing protein [Bradyrhizobium diazoefficiens]